MGGFLSGRRVASGWVPYGQALQAPQQRRPWDAQAGGGLREVAPRPAQGLFYQLALLFRQPLAQARCRRLVSGHRHAPWLLVGEDHFVKHRSALALAMQQQAAADHVFQLAHVVEHTTFPMPDATGNIENEWAIHQLETTADFAKNSWLITFFVGGLNYQAIHHLFPRICHVHYPEIAPIVEATAKEFGVPYLYNETFGKAFISHVRIIARLGKDEASFSAIANSMG